MHGLHHGGQDDRDEMAVYVEPPEYLLGLGAPARTAAACSASSIMSSGRSQRARARGRATSICRLQPAQVPQARLQGRPTILLLLFVPPEMVLVETGLGTELRELRPALLSRRAGRGYLGYLSAQKERRLGVRGQKRVNRPELIAAHGFDTKYAMHAARLGYQGLELLETGHLTLPMPEPERSRVMAIRTGERSFDETITEIEEVEKRLGEAIERTALPAEPDRARVDRFLVDAYRRAWGW